MEWKIRDVEPTDLSFIYATWLRSYFVDSALGRTTRPGIFYPEFSKVIDYILYQTNTRTYIACMETDPFIIFGYIVTQPETIHYMMVKEAFRRKGIGRDLFKKAQATEYTLHTRSLGEIFDIKSELSHIIKFNPFKLFKQLDPFHSSKTEIGG